MPCAEVGSAWFACCWTPVPIRSPKDGPTVSGARFETTHRSPGARDRELAEITAVLEAAAAHRPPALPERQAPLTPRRELEDEMMRICHRGDIAAALDMIRRHPDIAQAGLYEAVHQDHPDLVGVLLERGAKA